MKPHRHNKSMENSEKIMKKLLKMKNLSRIKNTKQNVLYNLEDLDKIADMRKIEITSVNPTELEFFEKSLKSFKVFKDVVVYFGMISIEITIPEKIGSIQDLFVDVEIAKIVMDYILMGVKDKVSIKITKHLVLDISIDKERRYVTIEIQPVHKKHYYLFQEVIK